MFEVYAIKYEKMDCLLKGRCACKYWLYEWIKLSSLNAIHVSILYGWCVYHNALWLFL